MPRSRAGGGGTKIIEADSCRSPFQACFRLYNEAHNCNKELYLNVNGGTWFGNGVKTVSHGITQGMGTEFSPDAFLVCAGEAKIATLPNYVDFTVGDTPEIGVGVNWCIKTEQSTERGTIVKSATARLCASYSVYLYDKDGNDCDGVKNPELYYNCAKGAKEPFRDVVRLIQSGFVRAAFVGNFVPVVCFSVEQNGERVRIAPKKAHPAKISELGEPRYVAQVLKSDYFYPAGNTSFLAGTNLDTWQEIAPNLWRYRGSAGVISRFMTTQARGTWYSKSFYYRTPCRNDDAFHDFSQGIGAGATKCVFSDLRAKGYGSGNYFPPDLSEVSSEIRNDEWCAATQSPFANNCRLAYFGFISAESEEYYDFSAAKLIDTCTRNGLITKLLEVEPYDGTEVTPLYATVMNWIDVSLWGKNSENVYPVRGKPQPVFLENAKLEAKYDCKQSGGYVNLEYFKTVEYMGFNSGENVGNGGRMSFYVPIPVGVLRVEEVCFPCYVCVPGTSEHVLCWRKIAKTHVSADTLGVSIPSAIFGVRYADPSVNWATEFESYSSQGQTNAKTCSERFNMKTTPTGGTTPAYEVVQQLNITKLPAETEHSENGVSVSAVAAAVLSSPSETESVLGSPFMEDSAEVLEAQDL